VIVKLCIATCTIDLKACRNIVSVCTIGGTWRSLVYWSRHLPQPGVMLHIAAQEDAVWIDYVRRRHGLPSCWSPGQCAQSPAPSSEPQALCCVRARCDQQCAWDGAQGGPTTLGRC
jgi:hypothetical protein